MIMSDKNDGKKPRKPKSNKESNDERNEKLIQAALKSHLLEYASKKSSNKEALMDILNLVAEQLSSFVIVGYNYDGEPLSCISAKTTQENDALCALVNKFIIQNTGPM